MNQEMSHRRRVAAGRLSFGGIVVACSLLVAITTIGGFLGTVGWALNILSHFRVQYLVCLSIAVVTLLLLRMRWLALVFGLFAVVNLLLILPLFLGKQQVPDSGRAVRAMLINVNLWNSQYDLVKQSIRDANPDVVVLEEVRAVAGIELPLALERLLPGPHHALPSPSLQLGDRRVSPPTQVVEDPFEHLANDAVRPRVERDDLRQHKGPSGVRRGVAIRATAVGNWRPSARSPTTSSANFPSTLVPCGMCVRVHSGSMW